MNKFFDLLSATLVIALILVNIIFSPPRFLKASDQNLLLPLNDQKENIEAYYTWEQDSWNILQVFHFFPTKRQLCLYNIDLDKKWSFNDYPNLKIIESEVTPFNIPVWEYWLATITISIGLILLYLIYIFKSIYNYNLAVKVNTFKSYKNFLLKTFIPKFLRKKAGLKLKSKISIYKKFLKVVTHKNVGELKQVIFKIIDSISETGNIKVNTHFEFESNIISQKEFIQKNIDLVNNTISKTQDDKSFNKWKNESLNEAKSANNEKEFNLLTNTITSKEILNTIINKKKEDLTKKLGYQYVDINENFSREKNIDRKYLFKDYLNELFKVIFPDQLITIENDCDSLITFHLKSIFENKDSFQFWKKDEGNYLKDIILLPDIKCSWEFYVSIKQLNSSKKEFVSKKIFSTTDYPLYFKNEVAEDYYKFIILNAFVNFTKEIASAFGMKRPSNTNGKAPISSSDLYLLFEGKISEFINEDIPSSLLEEFYGEYESSLDGLLISDEYLDLMFSGLDSIVTTSKEIYEGIDIIKESV